MRLATTNCPRSVVHRQSVYKPDRHWIQLAVWEGGLGSWSFFFQCSARGVYRNEVISIREKAEETCWKQLLYGRILGSTRAKGRCGTCPICVIKFAMHSKVGWSAGSKRRVNYLTTNLCQCRLDHASPGGFCFWCKACVRSVSECAYFKANRAVQAVNECE